MWIYSIIRIMQSDWLKIRSGRGILIYSTWQRLKKVQTWDWLPYNPRYCDTLNTYRIALNSELVHWDATRINVTSDKCVWTRTQISLCGRAVWSESLLSILKKLSIFGYPKCAQGCTDQTARMHRPTWIFAGRTCPKVQFLTLRPICIINPSLAEHDMPWFSKQCRSRSVGFWRSQLIWICTVCH